MKIQLMTGKPVLGSSYLDRAYWGLGTLFLASAIKKLHPHTEIEIVDGSLFDKQEDLETKIEKKLDIFGVSAQTITYPSCLRLAQVAKDRGAKCIIMGGSHATALAKEILQNQLFIDLVVRHQGELALSAVIRGDPLESIPNLVWRKDGTIVQNKSIFTNPDDLPQCDYTFLDRTPYRLRHAEIFPYLSNNIHCAFTHYGCKHAIIKQRCSFCAIQTPRYLARDPHKFWQEIRELHESLGISHIKDWGILSQQTMNGLPGSSLPNQKNLQLSLSAVTPDRGILTKGLLIFLQNLMHVRSFWDLSQAITVFCA